MVRGTLLVAVILMLTTSDADIHETMLKDRVRTDAYRDFIYDNKHLFEGKTVLDVGCGTGILSMFCAKAGAAQVIAVDNSDIIFKAQANIALNKLSSKIVCIQGKIEEVKLPVDKVDIIVSEWMGYGLLYEAMLNSVLWARDHYLIEGGLMVPSHCTMHIAPHHNSNYVQEHDEFWKDVYGFDMSAMIEKLFDKVIIEDVKPKQLGSESYPFYVLPLHTIKLEDLEFTKKFSVTLNEKIRNLDGWVIWFDTFFLKSPTEALPTERSHNKPEDLVAFTTGPQGPETHWHSCIMMIEHKDRLDNPVHEEVTINGTVSYKYASHNKRGVKIEIEWEAENHSFEKEKQEWYLE
jgi:protein arginine N-methyltransferase 3